MSVYQLDHFRTDTETAKFILSDIKNEDPSLLGKDILCCYRCNDGSIILDAETWHGGIEFYLEPYMNDDGHPWLYVCIDDDLEAYVINEHSKPEWEDEYQIIEDEYGAQSLHYPNPIANEVTYKRLI